MSAKNEWESVAGRVVSSGGIEVSIDGNAGTDESNCGSDVSKEGNVESIGGREVSRAGKVESNWGSDESTAGRVEFTSGGSLVVVVVGSLPVVGSVASKFSDSADGFVELAGGLVDSFSAMFTRDLSAHRSEEGVFSGQNVRCYRKGGRRYFISWSTS